LSNPRRRRLILGVVRTDRTFERAEQRGRPIWVGKCLHCGAPLAIAADGTPLGRATIEHIIPRAHGGTDDLANLALACDRCNFEKGRRHDSRGRSDGRRLELQERLQVVRRHRWREPEE